MKKIEAIIRTAKFEEVLTELAKIGKSFMTYSEVKGIGLEHPSSQQYRGTVIDVGFTPRTKLELVVPDEKADQVIECLLTVAQTGKIGDGKIFITKIEEVVRIRTGDTGEIAI